MFQSIEIEAEAWETKYFRIFFYYFLLLAYKVIAPKNNFLITPSEQTTLQICSTQLGKTLTSGNLPVGKH